MHKSASEAIKGAGSVAGRTVLARHYMTNRLTHTYITVMAGQAVVGICAVVVKRRTSKVSSVMAVSTILVETGRYVIRQFTDTNYIIVAGVTATYERRSGMIKGASGKGTRGVTNTAILVRYNVVCILTNCTTRTTVMTGVTSFTHYFGTAMINKSVSEISGVMARSTIVRGRQMRGYRRCFSGRINTIVIIVA